MDEYRAGPECVARYQTSVFELAVLRFPCLPLFRPHGRGRIFPAPLFRDPGSRRQSAVYRLDAQSSLCRATHLWSGAELFRFRLVDGTELSLVLHHVGPVHFCRGRRQFNVLARSCRYRVTPGRLPQGGDAGALSHHGEMDAGLLGFLGLHRFQPIHAVLVRQHSGRDAVLSRPEHGVMVAAELAPGHRAFLWSVRDSVASGNQETPTSTFHRCWLDPVHAGARYVSDRAALAPRHRCSSKRLGFPLPNRHRLQSGLPLSAVNWENVHFSSARSALDRVIAFEELTWPFPLHRKHQNTRRFLFGHGSASFCFFSFSEFSCWCWSQLRLTAITTKRNERRRGRRN